MSKTLKWLGGGLAAAMLLGLAGLFSAELVDAQTPPSGPPHRFAGSVSVDGEGAAAGTSVTASVNGTECGSATVLTGAAGSTYAVDVPSTCAEDGDEVSLSASVATPPPRLARMERRWPQRPRPDGFHRHGRRRSG